MDIETQNSKARSTAYLCYFLAALVMMVTAWFIVEGIQATEPASSARHAKVAAGVLLLILEGAVFSMAGKWTEFSPMLQALGWAIFALQITLMSLAQIAVGTTAGKAAQISTATVQEIRAQADASRQAAKSLIADAEKLRTSKHSWIRQQAGEKSTEAAQQTAAGADVVQKLQQLQAVTVSTPIVEMIGTHGLIALSIALSLILELSGIALMHTAGRLLRRADSANGQQVNVAPSSPAKQAQPEEPHHAPVSAPKPDFDFGFIPRTPTHAKHDAQESGELWTPPKRGEYFLSPTRQDNAKDTVIAAPAEAELGSAPTPAPVLAKPEPVLAPTTAVSDRVQDTVSDRVQSATPASTPKDEAGTPAPSPAAPKAIKPRASKPRTAAPTVRYDTGTDEDAMRYREVVAAVQARKIKPSFGAIEKLAGCRQSVAERFRNAMHASGVIEPDPDKPGQFRLKEGGSAEKSQLSLQWV